MLYRLWTVNREHSSYNIHTATALGNIYNIIIESFTATVARLPNGNH